MNDRHLGELGVFSRTGFLDAAACAGIRGAMDRGVSEAAEIYVNGYVVDPRVRQTLDVGVGPTTVRLAEAAFADVRPELAGFFGMDLHQAEGPGFLRYPPGGFYRAHRDGLDDQEAAFPRRVSLVLFLTDAFGGAGDGRCEGGALRLYGVVDRAREEVPLDIPPVVGTLIAFRSEVLHEVLLVTSGVRDAVVDWFS